VVTPSTWTSFGAWKILDGKSASEPEEYCTAIKDKIKDKKLIDINIKTPENFGRWFANITEVYDQMNIAAKKSEQHKLIHRYNESEFVKDIVDKMGKYLINIKEDYTRDCRNRRKWDLARLRSRIEYMQIRGELHDERDESSYTLQAKANAANDNSRRNYDDDKYNDQRDIKREEQPRMDGREIIMDHARTGTTFTSTRTGHQTRKGPGPGQGQGKGLEQDQGQGQ
jgi:hypothetical protein